MSMEYKYEITCMEIFNDAIDKVRSYAGPSENSDLDVDFEALTEEIKNIENILSKDFVYILTPKYHQAVMTTTKNLYTFTNRHINYVHIPHE